MTVLDETPATIEAYPELAAYPMVLTVKEVAEILRVSTEAVRRRCNDSSIRSIRFGTRVLVPRSEVIRLLTGVQ